MSLLLGLGLGVIIPLMIVANATRRQAFLWLATQSGAAPRERPQRGAEQWR